VFRGDRIVHEFLDAAATTEHEIVRYMT
jgi:hypothetical protein